MYRKDGIVWNGLVYVLCMRLNKTDDLEQTTRNKSLRKVFVTNNSLFMIKNKETGSYIQNNKVYDSNFSHIMIEIVLSKNSKLFASM